MKEAGTVLHLARSGRLILKGSIPVPREGSLLVDEKGRRTCKVLEVLGPISSPYLSAQPLTERVERVVGTKLYVSEEDHFDGKTPKSRSSKSHNLGQRRR